MEELQLIRKELSKKAEFAYMKMKKPDHFMFQKMDLWLTDIVINGGPFHSLMVDLTALEMQTFSVRDFLMLPIKNTPYSFANVMEAFCQKIEEEWLVWFSYHMKEIDLLYMDEKLLFLEVEKMIEEYELSPRHGSTLWNHCLDKNLKDVVDKWHKKAVEMDQERILEQSREMAKLEIENTIIVHLDKHFRQQKTRFISWQEAFLTFEQNMPRLSIDEFMVGIFVHSNWFGVHYDPSFVIWARQRYEKPSWR